MKKWETPKNEVLGISSTQNEFDIYGSINNNGKLSHECPICHQCFHDNKLYEAHKTAEGSTCTDAGKALTGNKMTAACRLKS